MQIPIEDIKVRRRARKKVDDLESLADSMRRYGLLNPITVNSRYVLVAGARRLEAAKLLGWKTIGVTVIDGTDKARELEIEIEENAQRANLSDEEFMAAFARLERLRNPGFLARVWAAIVRFFKSLFPQRP